MNGFEIRFKRQVPENLDRVPESSKYKPKAVPGGVWKPGSDTVSVWVESSLDEEYGTWASYPMVLCSECGIQNHLDTCLECTAKAGTDGKFTKNCSHC